MRYLVAVTSGMSDGEIAALKWSSFATKHRVRGYDVKRSQAIVGPDGFETPKTDNRERFIPVHSQARAALAE